MPSTRRFQVELAAVTTRGFSGKCFRAVALESYIKTKDPVLLFDLGPKISAYGQRFSPPDDHRGLYVSTELVTAGSEFADGMEAWKSGDCPKHVTFDMDVKLASVLDLTDATIRRRLKTSRSKMQSAWLGYAELNGGIWPPTWQLGHEAFVSRRCDGILFPSTKNHRGKCLLIFTERLVPTKTQVVIFKKDGSIWERLP